MESKKVECEKTKKERKRKLIFDEIAEVKRSRESTESCIATLNKDIIKYSFEAEEKSDLTLLTKANALQKAVTEKEQTLKSLNKAMEKLEEECKDL